MKQLDRLLVATFAGTAAAFSVKYHEAEAIQRGDLEAPIFGTNTLMEQAPTTEQKGVEFGTGEAVGILVATLAYIASGALGRKK